jgi:DNA-binding HxlR family transcriptional regulator
MDVSRPLRSREDDRRAASASRADSQVHVPFPCRNRAVRQDEGYPDPVKHDALSVVYCSVARAWSVLGERWTVLILREAFRGTTRFEAFQSRLGVGRTLLSDRLALLVDEGIFERVRYQVRPERYEYRLTAKGRELYPVLLALMQWGDRYLVDKPPVQLVHKACGQLAHPRMVCSHCAQPVGYFDLGAEYEPDAW